MPLPPIDLRTFRQPLHTFLRDSIERFSQEHPEVIVSTVAVYGFFEQTGSGAISFDTQAHSDQRIAENLRNGFNWYGEDEGGRFSRSPADFAFPIFEEFVLEYYPDLLEQPDEEPLVFIDHLGRTQDSNWEEKGDEGINHAVFPTLCEFVHEFEEWDAVHRDGRLRIGVVMHDSKCRTFWRYPV